MEIKTKKKENQIEKKKKSEKNVKVKKAAMFNESSQVSPCSPWLTCVIDGADREDALS